MENFRYLVRELTIIEGGESKCLSLQYVIIKEGTIQIFPFDNERAGFEYLPTLTLEKSKDGRGVTLSDSTENAGKYQKILLSY